MELPERIEKRMKQYGLNTLEEMVQAIDQQEPIDIGIFVSPVKGSGIYEKQSAKLAYAKAKGLDGIRKEVYKLFLHAEHIYKESGQGEQKLKWVVQQARGLLPKWLQVIMSEEVLLKIIDWWFKEVKDLLDDGKVNGSQN